MQKKISLVSMAYDLTVAGVRISYRACNSLKFENVIYVGDLVQKTRGEWLRVPNVGKKTVAEYEAALAEGGLSLGMDLPEWPPENIEAEVMKLAA